MLGAWLLGPAFAYVWGVKPIIADFTDAKERLLSERDLLVRERALLATAPDLPVSMARADSAVAQAQTRLFPGSDPVSATATLARHVTERAARHRVLVQGSEARDPNSRPSDRPTVSLPDNLFMGFSLLGVSMPVFWSALLFQYLFAVKLRWLPVAGFEDWRYVIMPAIVLGWSSAGIIARLTRSSLLEVMRNDYICTARAKGLHELPVIFGHALKNSLLPVVTVMAIQVAGLLAGAVITESVFGIPGVGRIAVNAIQARDMPLLQGAVLFETTLVILGNLAADVLYAFLDPRIKAA